MSPFNEFELLNVMLSIAAAINILVISLADINIVLSLYCCVIIDFQSRGGVEGLKA